MAKRKRKQVTSTRHGMRRRAPKIKFKKDKSIDYIECPFCDTGHAIIVGSPAHCGTHLELIAVQQTEHRKDGVVCVRCGEQNGTMVKVGEGMYAHSHMCSARTLELDRPKRYSLTAKLVWKLNREKMFLWIYEKLGIYPFEYKKIVDNVVTDEVDGYVWRKK